MREQWRAFSRFFFLHIRDQKELDLKKRFKYINAYYAVERPGEDPLSRALERSIPPHEMISLDLLNSLCPNCANFGHSLSDCDGNPVDPDDMELIQFEIKAFRAM